MRASPKAPPSNRGRAAVTTGGASSSTSGAHGQTGVSAGTDSVRALVEKAENALIKSQEEAYIDRTSAEDKRHRVTQLLLSAMEVAQDEQTSENCALLEQALDAAKQAGVSPDIRVRARKVLNGWQGREKRSKAMEVELTRLVNQLSKIMKPQISIGAAEDYTGDADWEAPWEVSARRVRAEQTIQRLKQVIDDASRIEGVSEEKLSEAQRMIDQLERERRAEEAAERKLRGLFSVDDADVLEDRLTIARERREDVGHNARQLAGELEEKYTKLVAREQRAQWLKEELVIAAERPDKVRLRQLVDQAKMLDLHVSPYYLTMLHGLEASETTPGAKAAKAKAQDHLEKLRAHAARAREAAERVVMRAEQHVCLENLEEATRGISEAKQAKVPDEVILSLERRIARLELKHGPRLAAEEKLLSLLKQLDPAGGIVEDVVIQDSTKIEQLRSLIDEARAREVPSSLVDRAAKILDRSVDIDSQRRGAEEFMRWALSRHGKKESDVDQLAQAVEEGKRCGIATLHAERELSKLRDAQVHREAAEAELAEARKGEGAVGRARLEAAIKDAKCVGVNAEELRAANARLAELQRHEKQCALLAGNLRRALPSIRSEPWHVQQLLESAKELQPWTPELERQVTSGQQQLDKTVDAQKNQRTTQLELNRLLQNLEAVRTGSQNQTGDSVAVIAAKLTDLLPRARSLGVKDELIRAGERQLKALKRENCQRNVAEHRLKLALTAKDLGEIERAVREVRALGFNSSAELDGSAGQSAKGRQNAPQSARLMDAASSMIRHLGDAQQRKQAAATALMVQISDQSESLFGSDLHGGDASASAVEHGEDGKDADLNQTVAHVDVWLKEVTEAVKEAQQSGVASSLIDHAKMKIREKRREYQAREKAVHELQMALSKKQPKQELLRNLQKVQRLGGYGN